MAKTKTSKRRRVSSVKSSKLILSEFRPGDYDFNRPEMVREILADCIKSGDMDTFEDVLIAFIRQQPKTKLAIKSKLGRQTLYDLLREDVKFNPEWETLSSILKAI